MKLTTLFDLLVVGSLIIMIIFWILFGIITMRKLDKAIVADGKPRPCQWDPIWGRAFLYTWPIIFSGKSFSDLENQIIDTQDVKKNINTLDKILAWILFSSTWTMIVAGLTGEIFSI